MTSPSSIGREVECMASAVLPHTKSTSPRALRGTVLHAFMAARAKASTDDEKAEALELVPEEWRAAAAAIEVPGFIQDGVAELAIAWSPSTGLARELGRDGAIDHHDIKAMLRGDEMGGIIDWLGLTPDGVVIIDYKFSYGATIDKAEINGQMRSYAAMACALFNRERAHLKVARIPDNGIPWWSHADLDAYGIIAAGIYVRQHLRARDAALEAYRSNGTIPTPIEGTWCGFCPAANACPAKVALLLATLAGDEEKAALVASLPEPLSQEAAAELWPKLVQAEKLIERLKGNVKDMARIWGGLKLPNGNILTEVEAPRESVDPIFARPVLEARFGVQQTNTAIKTEEKLTKASLDVLLKAHSSHGKTAKLKREVYGDLEEAGALRTVVLHLVQEVVPTSKKLKPAEEKPQLAANNDVQPEEPEAA